VAAATASLAAYLFLSVLSQPLISGNAEGADRGTFVSSLSPGFDRPARVVDYADGATATLIKWVGNGGPVSLTVTGVEMSPSYWVGLITIADARAGVVAGPDPCCNVDEQATWAAPSFRPIQLGPSKQAPVVLHILMSHCEYNSPGGTASIDSIRIHYSVLGFPHVQDVHLNTLFAVKSPDACPRSGPSRPSG